jgi:hypothetical protein
MTTPSMFRFTRFAAVALVGLAACTSSDNTPTASLAPSQPSLLLGAVVNSGDAGATTPEFGKIKLCKAGNVDGTFTITTSNAATTVTSPTTVPAGSCKTVAEDGSTTSGVGTTISIAETSAGFVSVSAERIDNPGAVVSSTPFTNNSTSLFVNAFHGFTVTYVNHVDIPGPPVCDFITFGRLVTEVNGQKVVISGNAGGFKPGGGTLGEFHIEVNGVDNHVSDITSYGPIASGALFGLADSRVVTGTAKNGVAVELRLWDGGEPGKGTDKVWVSLNGSVAVPTQFIDQGNMQYHPNCRGPQPQ